MFSTEDPAVGPFCDFSVRLTRQAPGERVRRLPDAKLSRVGLGFEVELSIRTSQRPGVE